MRSFLALSLAAALVPLAAAVARPQCVEQWKVAPTDTCNYIAEFAGMPITQVEQINNFSCSKMPVGTYICIRQYVPICTLNQTVLSTDTCGSIANENQITISDIVELNAQVDTACDNLVAGEQLCVSTACQVDCVA